MIKKDSPSTCCPMGCGRCGEGQVPGVLELLFGSHKYRLCHILCVQALHPVASRSESSKHDTRSNWPFFPKVIFSLCLFMLQEYRVIFTSRPAQKKLRISTEVCEHLSSFQWEEQIEADSSLEPARHVK